MAIYVPAGSDCDHVHKCKWHNGIYGYLKEIGIVDIDIV